MVEEGEKSNRLACDGGAGRVDPSESAFREIVADGGGSFRSKGEFADADASRFEYMAGALEEKFGPPLKKSPRHRIHKVSGDYLVARYLADESVARLVFIDDEGREAQKAREAAAKAERLAEQRRQFEEETAGL